MTTKLPVLPSALLAAGLLAASPAHAIDGPRVALRLSAMQVDADSELSGTSLVPGQEFSFDEDFDFGGEELVPRVEANFRLSERNRLIFNYFDYDKDQRATLDEDADVGGFPIPAGSSATIEAQFRLASLVYDFAVVETPTVSVGAQFGIEYARLDGDVTADIGDERFRTGSRDEGYAPVAGLRLGWAPAESWRVVVQGQYLDADWGSFGDYDGSLARANALVEYRFTPRLGVHAGYDWFRLEVEQTDDDGVLALDQRFAGPVVGVTLAF